MSVLCQRIRSHETDDEHFVALFVGQIVEAWCHDGIREARQGLEVLVRQVVPELRPSNGQCAVRGDETSQPEDRP